MSGSKATIIGFNSDVSGAVTIPDKLGGYPVTAIGDWAFFDCYFLTSIIIPNSVTAIGTCAFVNCHSLTSIAIPNSVTTIGNGVFNHCRSLTSITIPNGVTAIGDSAFASCSSLRTTTIPNSVTTIGNGAFADCSSLRTITIPNSVTAISNGVFVSCSSLTSITIPNSITAIGHNAFRYCSSLMSITIPNSVTTIGNYAFADCSSLTSIIISNSVAAIGNNTFYNCANLTIYGMAGSYAQTYVRNNNIPFVTMGGTQGNSNSTSISAPIINSARVTYSENTYDLFTQAMVLDEDSGVSVSITVDVNVNGCKDVEIYLTQGTARDVPLSNNVAKTIRPDDVFSAGKAIYVLAVDRNTGKSTTKETKLKIAKKDSIEWLPDGGPEGLNFSLGKKFGFIVPNVVPFIGGTEIKYEFDFIPVSVEYDKEDDHKINVVFGTNIASYTADDGMKYFKDFNFKKYKESYKKAASKQERSLKQLRNDFKMSNNLKMNLFGGNLLSGGAGSAEKGMDIAGYAEIKVIDGKPVFSEGQFTVDVEFSAKYEGQLFIWVVPICYEIGGSFGGGLEGKMVNLDSKSFKPVIDGYLNLKLGIEAGGGIGLSKVASLMANGELTGNLQVAFTKDYKKLWVEGEASFEVKVFGKVVAKKPFAEAEYLIYETGNNKGLVKDNAVSMKSMPLTGLYSALDLGAAYENESRAYNQTDTLWLGAFQAGRVRMMSAGYTHKNLQKLAENVYTDTSPLLCDINGTKVMVMQWDNRERSDANRTMLVYSVFNELTGAWSEPQAVYDDGTADFYPSFKDGYLVWQNQNVVIAEEDSLLEIARQAEICIAKWNGNGFDVPIVLTNNETLDTLPQVASDGTKTSVVWITNSENDILGVSGRNTIMQRVFEGEMWCEAKSIKTDLNVVTDLAVGYANGKLYTAYVNDADHDLNTITDREIYLLRDDGEVRLTHNEMIDSHPIIKGDKVYYYSGGNIVCSDFSGEVQTAIFKENGVVSSDEFILSENSQNETAIWWEGKGNTGTEIFMALQKDGEWSTPIQLTDIGKQAKRPSGLLQDDGTMLIAFNNYLWENNEIRQTDIYTLSVNPSYDIEVSDIFFDETSMTAYVTIKNSGELGFDEFTITMDDGEINIREDFSQSIQAGQSIEVQLQYNRPENMSYRTLGITAAISQDEYNTSNNVGTVEIGHADIKIDNISARLEGVFAVCANVSNIGYSDAENITVSLREDTKDGSVLKERTIRLSAGESTVVVFEVEPELLRFQTGVKQLYVVAEMEDTEISLGNNDGYVFIESPSGDADYKTEILNCAVVEGEFTVNGVVINNRPGPLQGVSIVAIYSDCGRLKKIATQDVIVDGNDDIGVDVKLGDYTSEKGDKIKMLLWGKVGEMTPLCPGDGIEMVE